MANLSAITFRRIGVASVIVYLLAGCAHAPPVSEAKKDIEEVEKDFNLAYEALGAERYNESAKLFSALVKRWPGSEYEVVAVFNLGASYEGLNDCGLAAQEYRRAIQASAKKFPRIEANSLVRLGLMYECVGQDEKATVTFLDARKRAGFLADDVLRAEIPARLVGLYSRLGNRSEAQKFFKEALAGIKYLRAQGEQQQKSVDLLAQTLYFMGRPRKPKGKVFENPLKQIKGFHLTQTYLLQAAELGREKWSKSALEDLMGFYQDYWSTLEKTSPSERDLRGDLAAEAIRSLKYLRQMRIPSKSESAEVKSLFEFVAQQEQKFEGVYLALATRNPLTPESQKRMGLRREGRVKSEQQTVLEKK